jgi:hypothetical protein
MIAAYQALSQARVNAALETLFDAPAPELTRLYAAMRYSVTNGGKRVRPLLVYAACEALAGNAEHANGAACAVELIHAYSLVHDDLRPWTTTICVVACPRPTKPLTKPARSSLATACRPWRSAC